MQLDAPIPGENFTSDTKNMPWHRPPDLVDYDDAIEYFFGRLEEPEQMEMTFAMIGIDAHITTIVSTILLQAIRVGKISIDLAILIAGPLARIIEIQAKGVDLKYDMGIDDADRIIITPTLLKATMGIVEDEDTGKISPEEALEEEVPQEEQGLMSMPTDGLSDVASTDEQDAMLGGVEEPVDEEVV
jgi:hypothetical protein